MAGRLGTRARFGRGEGRGLLHNPAPISAIAPWRAKLSRTRASQPSNAGVYVPGAVEPMLPEALSTDRTSLNEDSDRAAIVVDMVIEDGGTVAGAGLYRAVVRNRAKLTYSGVARWLVGSPAEQPTQEAGRTERPDQRPVNAGGADLEGIFTIDRVFHVELRRHLTAHRLAFLDRH